MHSDQSDSAGTILLIDDNPANLAVLSRNLEEQGYSVAVAQDGESGIERSLLSAPDLILLDVLMPGLDGFETCRRLKADSRTDSIPVIFMTALTAVEEKLKGFEVGGVDYVTKPLQMEELLARVRTHLTLTRLQHKLERDDQRLNVLLELSQLRDLSERKFIESGLAEVVCLTGSRLGFLHRLEPGFEPQDTFFWVPDSTTAETASDSEASLLSTRIWIPCLENNAPIIINDYCQSAEQISGKKALAVQRCAGVPIIDEGETVAVIGVADKATPYDEADLRQISLFAKGMWGILVRKRAVVALGEAKAEAENANLAKTTFLSNMSHELRTPLTSIIGYSQLLQRKKDLAEDVRHKIEVINRSGQHLVKMINDVLEVSRIEAGHIEQKIETFNPQSLLDEIKAMFELQAQERGLWLRFDSISILPRLLSADQGKLHQILLNLIGNACKFTETGGVTVTSLHRPLNAKQVELVISVQDTGPGIAPEDLGTLFEPFGQGSAGRMKGGSGLGLALSRKYAHLLSGDIRVNSLPEEGSCFTLTCRAALQQDDQLKSKSQPGEFGVDFSKLKGLKLLLADDDTDVRSFMVQLLQPHGILIFEAENGQQAIELALSEQPDLIVMDVHMPVLDGYDAIRYLKSSTSFTAPIMAVSASALDEDQHKISTCGADCFLTKPVDIDEFFVQIAHLLKVPLVKRDAPGTNNNGAG